MNDLHIENHMVLGDYYTDGKVAYAERLDDLTRDALNGRDFSWIGDNAREILCDLAHAVLTAKSSQEAGVEAYRVLEAAIEEHAEAEMEAEQ